MTRVTSSVLIALSLVFAARAAPAADFGAAFTTRGAGTVSCGSWTEGRYGPDAREWVVRNEGRLNFLLGYITANNKMLPMDRGITRDLAEGADIDALAAWTDNYCSVQPQHSLTDAASFLVNELRNKWFDAHPAE